jgi:hypothetical protein
MSLEAHVRRLEQLYEALLGEKTVLSAEKAGLSAEC